MVTPPYSHIFSLWQNKETATNNTSFQVLGFSTASFLKDRKVPQAVLWVLEEAIQRNKLSIIRLHTLTELPWYNK